MPKPNKTSATSATRKKAAAKKGGGQHPDNSHTDGDPSTKGLTKAQKKAQKNAPRQKVYIPPPKPPAPVLPDPLDAQGLAKTLPADLVVVLRRLGKKDPVTRRKGLEDLRDDWVDGLLGGKDEDGMKEEALVMAIPVWLHHLPSLLLSTSHRSLSLSIHSHLLSNLTIRVDILQALSLGLLPGEHQVRDVLGSWLSAALEEGRRGPASAGGEGLKSWEEFVSWDTAELHDGKTLSLRDQLETLVDFLSSAILDPKQLFDEVHPAPVAFSAYQSGASSQKTKKGPVVLPSFNQVSDQAEEDAAGLSEETAGRYRASGIQTLAYLMQQIPEDIGIPPFLESLLGSSALWDLMRPPTDDATIIPNPPPVRRAMYPLLLCLSTRMEAFTREKLLTVIGPILLDAVWDERDSGVWSGGNVGEPLVVFLTKYRSVWELEGVESEIPTVKEADAEDDSGDEDDGEDDEKDGSADEAAAADVVVPSDVNSSKAGGRSYLKFLKFLHRACNGQAQSAYPLVLVIISTIPVSILPFNVSSMQQLLTSLWSPIQSKIIASHSTPGSVSSIYSLIVASLDCISYLLGKCNRLQDLNTAVSETSESASGDATVLAQTLVNEDLLRIWTEGILVEASKPSRTQRGAGEPEAEREAQQYGKTLARILQASPELCQTLLSNIQAAIFEACFPLVQVEESAPSRSISPSFSLRFVPVSSALSRGHSCDSPVTALVNATTITVANEALSMLQKLSTGDATQGVDPVVALLSALLAKRGELVKGMDGWKDTFSAIMRNPSAILSSGLRPTLLASFFAAYLEWIESQESRQDCWVALSHGIHDLPGGFVKKCEIAKAVLEAVQPLKLDVSAENTSWEDISLEAMQAALSGVKGSSTATSLIATLFGKSQNVLTSDSLAGISAMVSGGLHSAVQTAISSPEEQNSTAAKTLAQLVDLFGLLEPLDLLALKASGIHAPGVDSLFDLAYVVPEATAHGSTLGKAVEAAQVQWNRRAAQSSQADQSLIQQSCVLHLREHLLELDNHLNPADLVEVAAMYLSGTSDSSALINQLLPSSIDLGALLDSSLSDAGDPTISILDQMVSPEASGKSGSHSKFDWYGRSAYGRCAEALVALCLADRSLAQGSASYLWHCSAISLLAKDEVSVSGGSREIYSRSIDVQYPQAVAIAADQLLSYCVHALAASLGAPWHQAAIGALTKESSVEDVLLSLLRLTAPSAAGSSSDLSARTFRNILVGSLRGSDVETSVVERWLALAQSIDEKNVDLAIGIVLAVKVALSESPRLDRYRNDVASRLSGTPVGKAGTKGLGLLRVLNALAPSEDSTSLFLPQQRTIFLLRTLNSWLLSEDEEADDLPQQVELCITQLCCHVCPIVQDVPGSHWDSIFDLISSNLEASDLSDKTSYPLLYSTLELLDIVTQLCSTNKVLRASWEDKNAQMKLVLQLLLQIKPDTSRSSPRREIEARLMDLIGSVNSGVMVASDGLKLYPILSFADLTVQKVIYRLLNNLIIEQTPKLVLDVEASLNEVEAQSVLPKLPEELLVIIQQGGDLDLEDESGSSQHIVAVLLAWLLAFDHFEQASATLRSSYMDQIRSLGLISEQLIPLLVTVFDLGAGGGRAADAGRFSVDEFYIDAIQTVSDDTLQALVAHVFYRSLVNVPTLVRSWYESNKDRQLSLAFSNLVTKHFSPVLIGHEFTALREPSAMARLQDENLSIKVLSGAAEVTASYTVDEQPMEIGVKLPADFPLRGVEVRDLKRVGVPENKWRGWLLNVQQLITSRNGLILDALTLFKKNVSLHFEGVEECAICYSIIDGNGHLPSKPCPVCSAKFHSLCIYKWWKSSAESGGLGANCPLCRSQFM